MPEVINCLAAKRIYSYICTFLTYLPDKIPNKLAMIIMCWNVVNEVEIIRRVPQLALVAPNNIGPRDRNMGWLANQPLRGRNIPPIQYKAYIQASVIIIDKHIVIIISTDTMESYIFYNSLNNNLCIYKY